MKRFLLRPLAGVALWWFTSLMSAQPPVPGPSSAAYRFAPADLMPVGAYYYPEAWPREQWPRDIANIRRIGLEFVHMGEFAWAYMEPSEGKFDFEWLDRAVQLAQEQNLKIVLCTPTPTPPIWLTEAHPDVLMVDALAGASNMARANTPAGASTRTGPTSEKSSTNSAGGMDATGGSGAGSSTTS